MSLKDRIAVGIDVSKAKLDVFHGGRQQHKAFQHSTAGIAELIAWLLENDAIDVVVLEASGGYEMDVWPASRPGRKAQESRLGRQNALTADHHQCSVSKR